MARKLIVMASLMLALSMLLAACGEEDIDETPANGAGSPADLTATPSQAPDQPELDGTSWLLSGFADRDLDSDIVPTLAFEADQLTGNAGCNDYGAQYSASSDGSFTLDELIQTEMDCETGMDIEGEYLQYLSQVERYAIDGTRLELQDADGNALLVFMQGEGEAPSSSQLDGTSWLLDTFNDEPVPDEFEDITLHFDGNEAGGTVCNTYGGSYTVEGDIELTFSDMFQTEMYCTEPDGLMDLEQSYLATLSNDVTAYTIDSGTLTLLDVNGEALMTFVEGNDAAGQPLQDTGWAVVEIDGEPIIEGTDVTLDFDSEGGLAGSGGCNGYGGAYTATDEGTFDAFDVAMTLMACMDPEGVMDQETAFHDALREATAYELDGDVLRLLDDSGTVRLLLESTFDPDEPVTDAPSSLKGTTWVATAINGQPLQAESPYTLQFAVNGPTGKAGCASWSAQFTMESDGSVTHETRISPSVYDAHCDDEDATSAAQAYVDTMVSATSYMVGSNTLHLMNDEGMAVLEFQRGLDGGELDGTSWMLTTLNGETPPWSNRPTLDFDFEWATGQSYCNGFGGAYMVVEPGTVVIADIASTAMGCEPEEVMELESTYFDTLHQITGYVMTDDSLQLMNADGETVITYEPAPEMFGLVGTDWLLVEMNGEQVDPDSGVTLTFRTESMGGYSGCNGYGVRYDWIEIDAETMVIDANNIETEEQDCPGSPEPEYYETLGHVAAYEHSPDELVLIDESGKPVLVFEAAP